VLDPSSNLKRLSLAVSRTTAFLCNSKTTIIEDRGMKAIKRQLTAATLSAFLALAGVIQAQDTGGSTDRTSGTGKKPGKITHSHKGGKKGHKGGKKGHKGGKKGHKGHRKSRKQGQGATTPPPK
jgi:hypothetical protein